jgi:hypothetical protein
VDSKIRSHSAYSANDWRLPAQPFEKQALYGRPHRRPLVMTLLLSLGLWAAIWGVVASLASAVLG